MSKNIKIDNTISNEFIQLELNDLLAIKRTNQLITSDLNEFDISFKKAFGKSSAELSRIHYVLRVLHQVGFNKFSKEDFRNLLLSSDFLKVVLDSIEPKKLAPSKTILRKLINYYVKTINLHPLSPEKHSALCLINQYGKETKKRQTSNEEFHPMVTILLDYITEKNQKWQKLAYIITRVFLRWLVDKGYFSSVSSVEVGLITYEMLEEFRNYLSIRVKNGLSTHCAQHYIQVLRRWFGILKNKGYLIINPASKLQNFHVIKVKRSSVLTLDELNRFLDCILQDDDPFLWFLVFGIQATLGLRANEVLGIKRGDLNLKTGEVLIFRKYHKEQTLPIPGVFWILLKRYLELYPGLPSDPLWKNTLGDNLKIGRLIEKFHYFLDKAGITEIKGATHNFRHLLLTELCYQEQDLRALKVLADVESERTLDLYIHGREEEVYQAFQEKFKPVGVDIKWF